MKRHVAASAAIIGGLVTAAAPASAASPSLSGPSLSGPSLSGPSLSGPSLSGPSLSGPSLSGLSLSGLSLSGLSLSGAPRQGDLVYGRVPPDTVALELDGKPVPYAADGRFVLGFDRDQPPHARLVARTADGRALDQRLAVAARAWRIERIDAARRPGHAGAAWLKRREGELARIAAARAEASESKGWRQRFVWPARGRISGRFGAQRIYRGEPASFHSGVDVAAGAGAMVVAPADGIVVLAGPPAFSLEGNLVIVDHGFGLNSAFLHLASSRVRPGQVLRQGDPIGTVGATGRATGPHLHWSMRWRDARIDPQALVGPMPSGSDR